MIVLDTNVLSELMRPLPTPSVVSWIDQARSSDLRVTSITRAEILSGIAILPPGHRRQALASAADRTFARGFGGPVLAFDAEAADFYADIIAMRRRAGRSTAPLDMMIVAIAHAHGAAVATRNTPHLEGCGVELHNPWGEE